MPTHRITSDSHLSRKMDAHVGGFDTGFSDKQIEPISSKPSLPAPDRKRYSTTGPKGRHIRADISLERLVFKYLDQ